VFSGHYPEKDILILLLWKTGLPASDTLIVQFMLYAEKPVFTGVMSPVNAAGNLILTGMLGNDSIKMALHKISD